jgi:hypothetical protein
MVIKISTTNKTPSTSMDDFTCAEYNLADDLTDIKNMKIFLKKILDIHSSNEEQNELFIFELLADAPNSTTNTYTINMNLRKNYSTEASQSSTSSSPIDPPLVIDIQSSQQQKATSLSPL